MTGGFAGDGGSLCEGACCGKVSADALGSLDHQPMFNVGYAGVVLGEKAHGCMECGRHVITDEKSQHDMTEASSARNWATLVQTLPNFPCISASNIIIM